MTPRFLLIFIFLSVPFLVQAQSSTTEALAKRHSDALAFFFYNNTLRMLNQKEDKEFDELIKDIEKMRFLMIKKNETNFSANDFKKLVADYKAESFEEIMTSRHQGKNFDVFMKEKNGKTNGMLVLINDSTSLYVLDILGRIALDKVTKLYSTLDESSDISSRIKAFTGDGNGKDQKDHDDDEDQKDENH
jgi:hypothetical protein